MRKMVIHSDKIDGSLEQQLGEILNADIMLNYSGLDSVLHLLA